MKHRLWVGFLSLLSFELLAEDRFILFGGGASPDSGEASIESNVIWIKSILENKNIENLDVIFGAGKTGRRDVEETYSPGVQAQTLINLSKVYGSRNAFNERYRPNTVAVNDLAATKGNVEALFQRRVSELKNGDSLFAAYNGHGGYVPSDTNNNYFRLWENTRSSVRDMSEILSEMDQGATFRYVFPQCFSGAYSKLIFEDLDNPSVEDVHTNRCGFVPVSADKPSEGCRPDLNIEDYRDYSNFFFAAIDGKMRTGKPLAWNPDADSNGEVSLIEAHYYAISEAYGIGVPRSTSEVFLEVWQPWYLRWLPLSLPAEESHYYQVISNIIEKLNFTQSLKSENFLSELFEKRSQTEKKLSEAGKVFDDLKQKEKKLRKSVKNALEVYWPELHNPYGEQFAVLLATELDDINTWLAKNGDFSELDNMQVKMIQLDEQKRSIERDLGMLKRVDRLLNISNLSKQIKRFGNAEELASYESLLACESWNMP